MSADLDAQYRMLQAMLEPSLTAQELADVIQSTPVGGRPEPGRVTMRQP